MRSLPAESLLLSREDFHLGVFRRSSRLCVICGSPAVDAHHILERKLYPDGGYYLGNGAAVCAEHHWGCEQTRISVEQVRQAAGIRQMVLPPGFSASLFYDKWGNVLWPSGLRSWGPLALDTGARRALALGGFLAVLMPESYVEQP